MGLTDRARGIGRGVFDRAVSVTEAALEVRNKTLITDVTGSVIIGDERDLAPLHDWLLRTSTIQKYFGNPVFILDNVRTDSGRTEIEHGEIVIVDSHALMLNSIQTKFSVARTRETHQDFPVEHDVFRLTSLSSHIGKKEFDLHIDAAIRFVPRIGDTSARVAVNAQTRLTDDLVPLIRAGLAVLPDPNHILQGKMNNLQATYLAQKAA